MAWLRQSLLPKRPGVFAPGLFGPLPVPATFGRTSSDTVECRVSDPAKRRSERRLLLRIVDDGNVVGVYRLDHERQHRGRAEAEGGECECTR